MTHLESTLHKGEFPNMAHWILDALYLQWWTDIVMQENHQSPFLLRKRCLLFQCIIPSKLIDSLVICIATSFKTSSNSSVSKSWCLLSLWTHTIFLLFFFQTSQTIPHKFFHWPHHFVRYNGPLSNVEVELSLVKNSHFPSTIFLLFFQML